MRRKEKAISSLREIEAVIARAPVCRLAMVDGNRPYVVPLSFGYQDQRLYFHTAMQGYKLTILRQNPKVCFEIDLDVQVIPGKTACDWGVAYKSVIGFGTVAFVTDAAAKQAALDIIMAHYGAEPEPYDAGKLRQTQVLQVIVERMTGKQSPCP
jgi:nitroimidazol reductase NimA-like FMN-containing flavoprotein (pyridoxamine 5'-phosphate oxidase superfamily)